MNTKHLFQKDFIMVVIGQIISLFGNAILRYALPVYLLNVTHSAALFGAVSACAFLPMILFSPIGGIVADRVNKRNVMVILDFSTALLISVFAMFMGHVNLVILLIITLMALYGIQGAYQPAVQASLPLLADKDHLNEANAVINMVSSLSGLLGPVLGGVIYAMFGLTPILIISIICFFISAVMELFIHIPFEKQTNSLGIFKSAKEDMKESYHFIRHEETIIAKVGILLACINLVFSALIVVGVPVIVTEVLGFSQNIGNRLYGYAEGALACGGLFGGLIVGMKGNSFKVEQSYRKIFYCTLTLLPMGWAVCHRANPMISYLILVISCFVMMVISTIFSIQMMAFGQLITPKHLLGKVMAVISCLVMCAHPIGQAIYGYLFERFAGELHLIFFVAFVVCMILTYAGKKVITKISL